MKYLIPATWCSEVYDVEVDADMYDELAAYKWTMNRFHGGCNARTNVQDQDGVWGTMTMGQYVAGQGARVQYIDGNPLNCKRENLWIKSGSVANYHRLRPTNKSGYRGVYWYAPRSLWNAQLSFRGKRYNLGCFDCPIAAAKAYDAKAIALHGGYHPGIRLNFGQSV